MAWKVATRMEEVSRFVLEWQADQVSKAELCRRFGISRQTGYKLMKRFEMLGLEALIPRPPIARSHPHKVSAKVRALVLAMRVRHSTWGPAKLKEALENEHPELKIPAASTIGTLITDAGLVKKRSRRHARLTTFASAPPLVEYANDCWNADFKGEYRLGNGKLCYTLTVTDAFSRSILCCNALPAISSRAARRAFEELFKLYGLPRTLRTDNGVPFASVAAGGLSKLSAWWLSLGIELHRIEPGKPQQNGAHERMHRVLKAECTQSAARSFAAHQRQLDAWRRVYNEERPHAALGMRTPSSLYAPSARRMESAPKQPH